LTYEVIDTAEVTGLSRAEATALNFFQKTGYIDFRGAITDTNPQIIESMKGVGLDKEIVESLFAAFVSGVHKLKPAGGKVYFATVGSTRDFQAMLKPGAVIENQNAISASADLNVVRKDIFDKFFVGGSAAQLPGRHATFIFSIDSTKKGMLIPAEANGGKAGEVVFLPLQKLRVKSIETVDDGGRFPVYKVQLED
jgi:hypothetical protein